MVPKKILAIVNFTKKGVFPILEEVKTWGSKHGIEVIIREAFAGDGLDLGKEGSLAITLGGDGTFLEAAGKLAHQNVPILGVNLGSLGFLTQTRSEDLPEVLEQVRRGEFKVEKRMMLEGELRGERFSALNDLVVSHSDIDRFTELELFADDRFIGCYPGDGIIISTPTGCTAYSLAAGGPVVDPLLECIIATPLNIHKLGLRPIIFPPEAKLSVVAHLEAALLVDGDKRGELEPGDELKVRRSSLVTKMVIVEPQPSLFSLLGIKLNWGKSPRRKER